MHGVEGVLRMLTLLAFGCMSFMSCLVVLGFILFTFTEYMHLKNLSKSAFIYYAKKRKPHSSLFKLGSCDVFYVHCPLAA